MPIELEMKRVIRFVLVIIAVIFVLISLLILLCGKQISKNRLVFADMKDRVQAVHEFQRQHARLPSDTELAEISKSLPARYSPYEYHIGSVAGSYQAEPPQADGGWSLWFWRGEWNESYTSWDDHYTLADQASWWGFCGPLLFAPFVAIALLVGSRLPILRS